MLRRLLILVVTVFVGLSAVQTAFAALATAAAQPWQYSKGADRFEMGQWCQDADPATNLVLVFTVRGSGESIATKRTSNRLQRLYYPILANRLAQRGWRVYGLEGNYPALGTELIGNGLVRTNLLDDYIASSVGHADRLRDQLVEAMRRCPARKVILAAYSQGGIAVRAMIESLAKSNPRLVPQIHHIDLVADASADRGRDDLMPRGKPAGVSAPRRETDGVWAVAHDPIPAARFIGVRKVRAAQELPPFYSRQLQLRTDQYCLSGDPVCDTRGTLARVSRAIVRNGCLTGVPVLCAAALNDVKGILTDGARLHSSGYPYAEIAARTAKLLPRLATPVDPSTSPVNAPAECGSVPFTYTRSPGETYTRLRIVLEEGSASCRDAVAAIEQYRTDPRPCGIDEGNTCGRTYPDGWSCVAPTSASFPLLYACYLNTGVRIAVRGYADGLTSASTAVADTGRARP